MTTAANHSWQSDRVKVSSPEFRWQLSQLAGWPSCGRVAPFFRGKWARRSCRARCDSPRSRAAIATAPGKTLTIRDFRNNRYGSYSLMSTTPGKLDQTLAFLSVRRYDNLGSCGGLLLVNTKGRPLEFHCTSPVQPSRTQAILFGRTLEEFVFCEQIAQALITHLKQRPVAILTNTPELERLVGATEHNLIFLEVKACDELSPTQSSEWDFDGRAARIWQGTSHVADLQTILRSFHARVPIDEPFERIALALDEACQSSGTVAA